MESIEEFNVTDTMLWEYVKKGLTKKWLENEANPSNLEYLVKVYNSEYEGGIFNNEEDAIYQNFQDVYEAFMCATGSEGNYDYSDNWFKVDKKDMLLYSWDDSSMLDKLIDDMSIDIYRLSKNIDDSIVDKDNDYKEIVRHITIIQRYYLKTLEGINAELFKYIDENTSRGYEINDLKKNPISIEENKQPIKSVPKGEKLSELIAEKNRKVKELLNNNSDFLKGALYNLIIESKAHSLYDVNNQLVAYYNINFEFRENHKEEFEEVNLNLDAIGEFII